LANDRHGCAVGFEKKEGSVSAWRPVGEFQGEHLIGDEAEFVTIAQGDLPTKRLPVISEFIGQWELVTGEQSHPAEFAARQFKPDHYIGNQQRMFEKQPPDSTVLQAPIQISAGGTRLLSQQCGSLASEAIDHGLRTAPMKIINLRAWTFQVAVMEEKLETPQQLLRTVTDQRGDV